MRRLALFSLLFLALAPAVSTAAAAQASSEVTARGPFSETELIKGLAGGMSNKRLLTLVGEYGADFSLTPEVEERLRAVGAGDELMEAIRKGKAKPVSENDLLKRLAGGMANTQLVRVIGQYGVDFPLTPETEDRLRAAGAGDDLVEAIRRAKPKQETPAPATPVPAPSTLSSQGKTKVNPRDGLTYVWIPPGTFQMGCSPGDDQCDSDEKPAHTVAITKGFWMGQTEVTQAAYQRVMGRNPSFRHGDRLPAEGVTWDEANAYCGAVGMRLPTEAEWEYAARAGSTASRHGDVDAVAWHDGNSGQQTHEVGQKGPNAWKLYDMLGNVWEWVADWYDLSYSSQSPSQDPQGPSSGENRALRGSAWGGIAPRVSERTEDLPGNTYATDRKSTRLNSSHIQKSRMPSSA